MKNKLTVFTMLFIIGFLGCYAQNQNTFTITGGISGGEQNHIILKYTNDLNIFISDTAKITKGTFKFTGKINEPSLAYLVGKVKNQSVDDPNFTEIFLEPKKMQINVNDGKFKYLEMVGSKTQTEYEGFRNSQKDILLKSNQLGIAFGNARIAYNQSEKSASSKKNLDSIRVETLLITDKIQQEEKKFSHKNPNSYVSAYFLFRNSLPVDSISIIYQNLSPVIKSSFWGLKVYEKISNTKASNIEQTAPLFEIKDKNGDWVRLIDYKNKNYVLLDFWASWCIPCRQATPSFKKLYEQYHSKGLEIISVSIDDNEKNWLKAVADDQMDLWRNIMVGSKDNSNSIRKLYQVQPVPTYILINREGIIIGRYTGIDEKENQNLGLTKKLEEEFR
jgi:peroxiredoxin